MLPYRLFTRHARPAHLVRNLVLLAVTICAATLLPATPLATQAQVDTLPRAGADTTSTSAVFDSPSVSRRAPSTAARDTAANRARAREDSIAAAETERNKRDGGWGRFPKPTSWAVFMIILLGALGALAGDLVVDGTRLDRWRKDDTGWTLGYPGRLLIGVVTALLVVLGIRPPNGSWPILMSTALAVGAASEAILLAIMASWKARMAESETRRVRNAALEKIEGMRIGVRAIHEAAARGASGAGGMLGSVESRTSAGLAAQLDRLADQAKTELIAETVPPPHMIATTPSFSRSTREVPMRDSFDRSESLTSDRGDRMLRTEAAEGRKMVVITYTVPDSDFSELLVDDVSITPDGDGVHRAIVGPGEHVLHCRAQTRPNVEYEVEITDPEEARWKPDPPRAAAPSGIINDFKTFHING